MKYIISPLGGRKALLAVASLVRLSVSATRLDKTGWTFKRLYATASQGRLGVSSSVATKTGGPVEYYNAMSICHGDGVTDDTNHILAAIASYKAAGKAGVYFPSGTYLLSSTLTIPNSSVLVGASMATVQLKGRVVYGNSCQFTDMKIGNPGTSTQPYSSTTTGTTFTRCQFRGGGGTPQGDDSSVLFMEGGVNNITFDTCNIEANSGTEDANKTKKYNSMSVFPNQTGTSISNILFKGCHFGVSNGVTIVGPRFHVEIWEDPSAGTRTTGVHNFNFEGCTFEAAQAASIDYSGATLSSDGTTPASGYSHITGCTFRGNGAPPDPQWCNDITTEGGAGYLTITGNTFYKGYLFAYRAEGVGGHNTFSNNTVDATQNPGNCSRMGDDEYLPYVQIDSNNNTVTNNIFDTPAGSDTITNNGDNNTISGNTFL